jgi:hypothetical protein
VWFSDELAYGKGKKGVGTGVVVVRLILKKIRRNKI